ncbi:unnamed protein product, partial [marine sediment metagenome]
NRNINDMAMLGDVELNVAGDGLGTYTLTPPVGYAYLVLSVTVGNGTRASSWTLSVNDGVNPGYLTWFGVLAQTNERFCLLHGNAGRAGPMILSKASAAV